MPEPTHDSLSDPGPPPRSLSELEGLPTYSRDLLLLVERTYPLTIPTLEQSLREIDREAGRQELIARLRALADRGDE